MQKLSLFALSLFSILSVAIFAQDPFARSPLSSTITLRFEAIGPDQGLPHRTVDVLFQDRQGFIWMGTPAGLVKYDGYQFSLYRYHAFDTSTVSASIGVITIAEDERGDLWVGCTKEPGKPVLFRFDRRTERLIPQLFDPVLQQNRIQGGVRNLCFGQDFLWINADHLYRLPVGQLSSAEQTDLVITTVAADRALWRIYMDTQGRLWAPELGGLYEWIPEADTLVFHPLDPLLVNREDPVMVNEVVEGVGDKLLLLTRADKYLVYFDPRNKTYEVLPNEQYRRCSHSLQVSDDQLWLGRTVGEGGVYILKLSSKQFLNVHIQLDDRSFFPLQQVRSMLQTSDGTIWIGTKYGPLLKHHPQKAQFHWLNADPEALTPLSNDVVTDLSISVDSSYWITTYGGGLNLWNRSEQTIKYFRYEAGNPNSPRTNTMLGVVVAPNGKVWFGEGFSVGSYDPGSGIFKHYDYNASVHSLLLDRQHRLWVAWMYGLLRYDPINDQFVRVDLPAAIIGLQDDRQGNIWMGRLTLWSHQRSAENVLRYQPTTEQLDTIALPEARCFYEDRQGYIWMPSSDGLFRYDPGTESFYRYGIQHGLPHQSTSSVIEDEQGYIWIGTDNGLSRFDPATQSFRNYFREDGLPFNEFSPIARKNARGELFFNSQFGLLYFHPDSIRDDTLLPQIAFTGIDQPLDRHISLAEQVRLSHWQNDLTIHYAALHFKNPERNLYTVMLEGYDTHWRDTTTQPFTSYTNLGPGRYTFRVKAANSDGAWNEAGISLGITILPPWYWNNWTKLLYLTLLTGAVIAYYRFQLNRRLALAEADRLRELDEIKSRLYTNITHEFRTPLTVIQGVAEQIDGHETERELIQRNSRQLLDLINRMLDLSKLEAGKLDLRLVHGDILPFLRYVTESFHSLAINQKINLNFHADTDTIDMDYDAEKVLQILSNLISNALKFTPEYGKINITARDQQTVDGPALVLQVQDTGIGIAPDKLPHIFDRFYQVDDSVARRAEGTGIGLALVRELVLLMDGKIEVESRLGEGTTFIVKLPIRNVAPTADLLDHLQQVVDQQQAYTAGAIQMQQTANSQNGDGSQEDLPLLLIVEDNADVRQYLTSCLRDEYELLYARNGREGIEQALEHIPDIIISDVMMPEVDGFEMCRTLKQDERTSHIPIIMLTAKADMASKLEGLEYGADAYLVKPFHRSELHVRLRKLIELRQRLQAKYRQPVFKTAPATQKEDAFVLKVRQLVLDHLDDSRFGIEALSGAMHMSRVHLYRKLKALTGQSTSHFIRRIRLQEGYKLLRKGELNVSEVAYSVGFSDPGYFSKLFWKEYGQLPSEVR